MCSTTNHCFLIRSFGPLKTILIREPEPFRPICTMLLCLSFLSSLSFSPSLSLIPLRPMLFAGVSSWSNSRYLYRICEMAASQACYIDSYAVFEPKMKQRNICSHLKWVNVTSFVCVTHKYNRYRISWFAPICSDCTFCVQLSGNPCVWNKRHFLTFSLSHTRTRIHAIQTHNRVFISRRIFPLFSRYNWIQFWEAQLQI